MDYLIKKVCNQDLNKAFSLIWNTFLEFVAPDYSIEGIETFKVSFIENDNFKDSFKNGKQIMYGAYFNDDLAGVVSISSNNNVSCAFVDKKYHRKGIATLLFKQIISELKDEKVEKITLNASPYAIPFYNNIGFKVLDEQKEFHGIIYTPMELIL